MDLCGLRLYKPWLIPLSYPSYLSFSVISNATHFICAVIWVCWLSFLDSFSLLSNPCNLFIKKKYAFCILNTMTIMPHCDWLFHLIVWCCCMYLVISRLRSLLWCYLLLVCCWFCGPWCICVCVWTAWWRTVYDNPWSACCEADQLMVYTEGMREGVRVVGSERWLCGCSP